MDTFKSEKGKEGGKKVRKMRKMEKTPFSFLKKVIKYKKEPSLRDERRKQQ